MLGCSRSVAFRMNRREFIAATGALPALGLPRRQGPASGPTQRERDIWVEVDLDRIGFNLESIRRKARGRKVMAVVKANGYGHGLVELGRYLDGKGIDGLMVGNFREALTLRDAGVRAPILNFGPAFAVDPPALIEHEISQVVFTPDVDALSAEGRKRGRKARVHVLIDTGLGRLGVPYHEAFTFIEKLARLPGMRIEGVMTAFTEDRDFDSVQLARFDKVCAGRDLAASISASGTRLRATGFWPMEKISTWIWFARASCFTANTLLRRRLPSAPSRSVLRFLSRREWLMSRR